MTTIKGTQLDVRFNRVVDGDTIRVFLPDSSQDESLRILALDTEESNAGGDKPVTPWGKQAKARAERFFEGAETVTIEFPGNEDVQTCLRRYRGNFGRLLVFVYRDDVDFQQTMIREGYSPYFMKYGNAAFAEHHQRYERAERESQAEHIGVWDQIGVNNKEMRDYAALCTWWQLRASAIDEYRKLRALDEGLLDTRLDYDEIKNEAVAGKSATVFTEIGPIEPVGGNRGVIGNNSRHQPFSLFLPEMDSAAGRAVKNLLDARYISDNLAHLRRSYAYVSGPLSTFQGKPQLLLSSVNQVADAPTSQGVTITALLPDPIGADRGLEQVTLRNLADHAIDLQGWTLRDLAGHELRLAETLAGGQERDIGIPAGKMPLNNTGDEVVLVDPGGRLKSRAKYAASDVKAGQRIRYA